MLILTSMSYFRSAWCWIQPG